ncbi:hypothetical protein L0U85_01610 [Glycomyces sp. L485]|uniref:hypothetical protein n=1 Tax=Glycomyces sp. L485 TaxID=2909235 RepID=UPI001F4A51AC|nr:hypothetical protein [Glycomyces sp. L485]MCH7229564.1 hypothetical protein [Glycomyces sp. L485]
MSSRHGLHYYSTDEVMPDHARRTNPEDAPFLHRFIAMSMDERWLHRSPETMMDTFHWFRGEGFELIIEDLLRLAAAPGVIVEGFRLLPHLVKPLLAMQNQAVWLLPTADFRRAAIRGRGSPGVGFLHKTSAPELAEENLAERDRMFTEHLYEETERLALRRIRVDPTMTEEEVARQVAEALEL